MNKKSSKSILSWLMGLSLLIAAPVAMADRGDHHHGANKHKHHQAQKHQKRVKKDHHMKKHVVKHYKPSNRHHGQHRIDNHGWSFTISNHEPYYSNYGYRQVNKRKRFNRHMQQIRKRQANQKKRIRKGIKRGQLVRFEKRELRQQQRRIANRIAKFSADGRLNRHERNKINRMQDRASDNIRNKKHNQYTRYNSRHHNEDEYIAYYHH